MKTKILLVFPLLLILSSCASAFTPAPCVTTTNCDCEIEFCTYSQALNYTKEEKFKDLVGLLGTTFGKSTTFDIYIYGAFPPDWAGQRIITIETPFPGVGFKTKNTISYKGLENVSGFHQYKVMVDPYWGWQKATLRLGFTFRMPGPIKGINYNFAVNDPGVDHIDEINSNPLLEKSFKTVCDGWKGRIDPWPCIGLFEVGEPIIRRKISGTISPSGHVASIFIKNAASAYSYAKINTIASRFEISPVEPGITYKLSSIVKQGSSYLNWAEDIIVPLNKDLQKNIILQQKPTTAQGSGKGSLKIELVSETGTGIAGTVSYNILTNPNKVETAAVPATGLILSDLPAGNYKFVITPTEQKYAPNPQTIYQFSIKSNITNVLKVTFDETDASSSVGPPASAKTGDAKVRFTDFVSQLKGKVSNPIAEINKVLTVKEDGTNRNILHEISGENFIILKDVKVGGKYILNIASIKAGDKYVKAATGTSNLLKEENLIGGGR